ncbi:unnamed protein product, partial [Prorocentrum cordatum]
KRGGGALALPPPGAPPPRAQPSRPRAAHWASMREACAADALTKVREAVAELQEADFGGLQGLQRARANLADALEEAKEAGVTTEELLEAARVASLTLRRSRFWPAACRRRPVGTSRALARQRDAISACAA